MSDELPNNEPPKEPSVLDYVKSLFRFGSAEKIRLPKFVEDEKTSDTIQEVPLAVISHSEETLLPVASSQSPTTTYRSSISNLRSLARFPWRSLLALLLALLGQRLFEPPPGNTAI